MRLNLIKEINKLNDITNTIILTHNVDFIFLQSVVLNAFSKIGHPKLTVFADAQCSAESFEAQFKVLDSLGVRYRVVPVPMTTGFRFHPKAIFLSGSESAHLFVGSGNLTFGGWFENAEVWAHYDSEPDGINRILAFKQFLDQIVDLVLLPHAVRDEVDEAFDKKTKTWVPDTTEPAGLIFKAGNGNSLLNQIREKINVKNAKKIYVCTPYFDAEAEALKNLAGTIKTTVFVQNGFSTLKQSAAATLPSNFDLRPVKFYHSDKDDNKHEAFIHAKFFAFDYGKTISVFAGSANCSRAALSITGTAGNAELLAFQEFSSEDFGNLFLNEMELIDQELKLSDNQGEPICDFPALGQIKLLAVRFEAGVILVGYKCSKNYQITKCFVNDTEIPFNNSNPGELAVRYEGMPKYVMLEARGPEGSLYSNRAWVDYENELRSTARGRSLAHTIRIKVIKDYWNLGAWSDILDVFCKHLEYMPMVSSQKIFGGTNKTKNGMTLYTREDVFSSGFGLKSLRQTSGFTMPGGFNANSLQQLLLRWFGYQAGSVDTNDNPSDEDDNDNDDEPTDKPEDLPKIKQPKKPIKDSEKDRNKAKKFVNKVAEIMSSRNYLGNRPPELLGSDLKLISVLLLCGLRKNWITSEDYFHFTQLVWSKLFFSSEEDRNSGWFEVRQVSDEDFLIRLVSVELSSAFAIWAMAFPLDFSTAEKANFSMSCILSIARFPFIWQVGTCNEIADELQRDSLQHIYFGGANEAALESFSKRWKLLMRLGYAIRKFEEAMAGQNPGSLKSLLNCESLQKGELLWQGNAGYCVLAENCRKPHSKLVKVYSLQSGSDLSSIHFEYLTPIRRLLDERIVPISEEFNNQHRKYIRRLINTIRVKLHFD